MNNEYVGSLPTTIFAQSGELDNYRIYGTTDGVGIQTENLCPMHFGHTGIVDDEGRVDVLNTRLWTDKIPIEGSTDYVISVKGYASNEELLVFNRVIYYDANQNYISREAFNNLTNQYVITTISNAAYIVLDIRTASLTVNIQSEDVDTISVTEGSIAPTIYTPFGYKIPMIVECGKLWNKEARVGESFYFHMNFLQGNYSTWEQPESSRVIFIPIEGGKEYEIILNNTYQNVYTVNSIDKPAHGVTYKIDDVSTFINHGTVQRIVRQTDTQANWLAVHINTDNWENFDATIKEQQSNYNLYIGDSKLGAEEHLDYEEQKVWKRTENLFDKNAYLVGGTQNPAVNTNYRHEIPLKPNTTYTMSSNVPAVSGNNHLYVYSSFDSGATYFVCDTGNPVTFTTDDNGILYFEYAKRTYYTELLDGTYYVMLVEGSAAPSSYIPYLTPTDPSAPFPAINTYKDENTISSTETIAKVQFNWTIMEVASLKMPDNTYYDFKDTQGRAQLSEIQSWIDSQEGSISITKVGLQVDYQNKTNTRLGLAALAIDPNTGLPFTFDSLSIYSNRRRCNVNDAGEITAWYGDEDYKEDGSNGQVMVYQPKFYYRVEPVRLEEQSDGLGYHIRCANYWISETPITGFRVHPAFINEDNIEVDYYLIGAYEASIYDTSESTYLANDEQVASFSEDLLCSVADIKPASGLTQNLTRANCELMAKNRGNVGWHNTTVQIESAEQLLMMIELGTMNFQNAIGAGVTSVPDNSSYNCSALTGSTSILGNVSGRATSSIVTKGDSSTTYTANGYVSISYRGRENPYGNIWQFVEGMIIAGRGESKGGIPFICNDFTFPETSSTTAGTGTHDFTLSGYTSAGFTITNADGYISAMGYGNELYDWLFVASECSGNSTAPVGDYTYKTANLNGTRVALLGGRWNSGAVAGSFFWDLADALTARDRPIGGRAALIPRKLTHSILT